MTTAVKLNLQELLAQPVQSKSSGCLELNEGLVSWKIYLQQGTVKYVDCSVQNLDRLKYHLHYFEWRKATDALKRLPEPFVKLQLSVQDKSNSQNIYSKIIPWLLADKHLDLSQGIKLVENITQDDLRSCFWLDRGTSTWHENSPLPDWIPVLIRNAISLNVSEFFATEQLKLTQWQKCSKELTSVYQRPYFAPGWETKSLPAVGSLDLKTLRELSQVLRGRTSIRQLSILLKKSEIYVGKILSPYIDCKIIYLHHAQTPLDKLPSIPRLSPQASSFNEVANDSDRNTSAKTWKIICIDDSPTILSEIQRFLNGSKFEITAIDDPVKAVSQIFANRPRFNFIRHHNAENQRLQTL